MMSNQEIMPVLNTISWYKHGHYRNNYLFSEYIVRGFTLNNFRRAGINANVAHFLKIGWDHYIDGKDRKKIIKAIWEGFDKDRLFLQHYIERYKEDCDKAFAVAGKIQFLPVKKLTNKELIFYFQQFIDSHVQLGHWLWNLEFVNLFLDEHVRKLLKDKVKDIDAFLLDILYYKNKLDFIQEQHDLLRLALEAKNKKVKNIEKEFNQELTLHWQKYAWLNMYIYSGSPFDLSYYLLRLKEYMPQKPALLLKKMEKDWQSRKDKAERSLSAFKNNLGLVSLINIVQELLYFKSYRIDVYTHTTFMVFPLLEEISSRLNITRLVLVDLSEAEVIQGLLRGKIDLNDYEKRKIADVVLKIKNETYRFSGQKAASIRAAFLEENLNHLREVKGTMAYPGKVQGTAKVVQTELELPKVKRGDIIISPMTNPNYMPAFNKIVAIVTDEGGILCHSAIVSREMKIPCVMGTKIGTRVFKDGDLVEVDANKGVVRKL